MKNSIENIHGNNGGETMAAENEIKEKQKRLDAKKATIQELLKGENPNPEEAYRIIKEENEGDIDWKERRQSNLTAYYYEQNDSEAVAKIIAETEKYHSQQGRIKKFERIFQKPYTGPRLKETPIENPQNDSDRLRNAILRKDFENVWKILEKMRKEIDPKSDDHLLACKRVDERESEIFDALIKVKNFKLAEDLITSMVDNPHNKKYKSKEGRKKKLKKAEKDHKE